MNHFEDLSDDNEVDHAFFDSDADGVAKKGENGLETAKQKGPRAKDDTWNNKLHYKAALESQKDSSSEEEREKPQTHILLDGPNAASATSSIGPRPESAHSSGRNSSQSLKIHTTIPTGIPEIRREYEDSYYTDEEDSSDEGKARRYRSKSGKQSSSFKKIAGKKITHFSSSSSSSEAESSDSASCNSEPSSSKAKIKLSASGSSHCSSARSSKSAAKGSEKNKKIQDHHDESEDTVTDVTPLSTPDISPIQSFDLAATNEMKEKIIKRQENVSQEIYDPDSERKYNQKALHDAMDLNQLLKAFMHLDKKDQRDLVFDHPATTRSKNYSFTNDEVRHIERENQRLLKELTRQATKPRNKSFTPKKPAGPPSKLYHSTINRQKEQQRIEKDNMALLKRLESIKPTVGMKRSEQLMDYQRQVGYLSSSATSPRPVKSSVSRQSSAQGSSRASSALRSERSVSSTSSAALLRPTKSSNVRAAWL